MMKASRVLLVILWLQLPCEFGAFLWEINRQYVDLLCFLGPWMET